MIEILILSLIQGITEFLPISSSSHLILVSKYLSFENQSLSIDVSLHIGSFIGVICYFYEDIKNFYNNKVLFFKIFVASLPVMFAGYLLIETNIIETVRNIQIIAWTTIIFGILLFIGDKFKLEKNLKKLNYKAAFIIGMFQVLSLIPGVSRSGIAITAARFLNYKRVDSAKISFLLSIPILGAVSLFGLRNIFFSKDLSFTSLNLLAVFSSFIFSFFTVKYFLRYIKKFSLKIFVIYRILLGLILLTLTYL